MRLRAARLFCVELIRDKETEAVRAGGGSQWPETEKEEAETTRRLHDVTSMVTGEGLVGLGVSEAQSSLQLQRQLP